MAENKESKQNEINETIGEYGDNLIAINGMMVKIRPTSGFQQLKNDIPIVRDEAKKLLDRVNDEDIDEKEFDLIMKRLNLVTKGTKKIQDELKKLRAFYNEQRDLKQNQILNALNEVGYDDLNDIVNDINNTKKLIIENRKNERWNELKDEFNKVLNNTYPSLKEDVPTFTFQTFRNNHSKMVSGAKSRKITKKDLAEVTDYISKYAKDIQSIKALDSEFESKLIRSYVMSEDLSATIEDEKRFKEEQERERKRKEELLQREKQRIEEENKKKEKVAKLTKKEVKKESTENLDKLREVFDIMNKFFDNEKTEANAEKAVDKIREVVDK